mmetsp:Transcript_41495/g.104249  ORF Transcript_41495/g.104249 Transcript_41495/m.104249 type:complete len:188 (-) Transcript_41495:121-684(-)
MGRTRSRPPRQVREALAAEKAAAAAAAVAVVAAGAAGAAEGRAPSAEGKEGQEATAAPPVLGPAAAAAEAWKSRPRPNAKGKGKGKGKEEPGQEDHKEICGSWVWGKDGNVRWRWSRVLPESCGGGPSPKGQYHRLRFRHATDWGFGFGPPPVFTGKRMVFADDSEDLEAPPVQSLRSERAKMPKNQ